MPQIQVSLKRGKKISMKICRTEDTSFPKEHFMLIGDLNVTVGQVTPGIKQRHKDDVINGISFGNGNNKSRREV